MRASRGMSASSKPRPMWVRSLWAGWLAVSTPQGRAGWARWGESRQHRLPRKTPRAQGSGGGRGRGRGRGAWEGGVSSVQGGYPSRHMFLPAAEFQVGRGSRRTGQAQLSKVQAGLADGQCHFRACQWMWPMRGAPRSPPRGRGRTTTTPLPVRPSAGSR